MILSICIPSYNRGNLAYERVMELLNMGYEEDVQVCISNNGSTKNVEGYEKIKKIDNPRLKYHEFETNQNYVGNFNQVVKMSDGDFCMLISDEDSVVAENLKYYLDFFKEVPEIGIMKGNLEYYDYLGNAYCQKGMEAIKKFYMADNYTSGIIYNRKIVTNELIDAYREKYLQNNRAYYYYPHMMIDAYALVNSDFGCCDYELIRVGASVGTEMTAEEEKKAVITGTAYGIIQERIEQMQGFEQQIYDLEATDAEKLQMISMLIRKTVLLCNIQKENYIKNGYDWNEEINKIKIEIKRIIAQSEIPIVILQKDLLYEFVDECIELICRKELLQRKEPVVS